MKIYNTNSFTSLFECAEKSNRKRSHLNLHSNYDDKVQRLFIALTQGSYVEPHYHNLPHQWELFIIISGTIKITLYDFNGKLKKEILAGDSTDTKVIELQPNEIHSLLCISKTALLLEIKEGPFDINNAKSSFIINK